eukprot:TRINITY_DN5109_c0_g1_i2.p3 TRINITY_DN5109_c0_g1~~TRINITY_DN5109_c0_g1_i2.p3  ORF type:complete len:134 (-),score=43.72 TRINITY_DN5109_c0_g1_i2:100-501(-)
MVVAVFDVGARESFEGMNAWIETIGYKVSHDVLLFIVGNKADDEKRREVSKEEGAKFAKDVQFTDAEYFETSAKLGTGIEEMFSKAAKKLFDKIHTGEFDKDLEKIGGVTTGARIPSFLVSSENMKKKKGVCC